jgi:hypothetical protein
VQECARADCSSRKLLAFYLKVVDLYDARWIVKVDDSVYLNPQRLKLAATQWAAMRADYVGCMKRGVIIPAYWKFERQRHFDKDHLLLGQGHKLNAHKAAFALDSGVVHEALKPNAHRLRTLESSGAPAGSFAC